MKYVKKPVQIKAIQWDGTLEGIKQIKKEFPAMATDQLVLSKVDTSSVMYWSIKTLEGPHIVNKGDYVIKGIAGELYPCKPAIFLKTYDPV